jgi:response regulator RpfG family c-di-GMP phosphodiesterase
MIDSTSAPSALTPLSLSPDRRTGAVTRSVLRILVVDDDEASRRALDQLLRKAGYDVHVRESGAAALALLELEQFAVMLCDDEMPGISGLQLVQRALRLDPDLAVLLLGGVNEARAATSALSQGALEYLVRPVAVPDLDAAIARAAHRRQLEIGRRSFERQIREEVMLRTMELEKEKAALRALTIGIAETLINAMEAKDVYLRGHSQRVAEQAASVAEELALHPDVVEDIRLAGRLHDIGKIGIREAILNKPDALTAEEYAHVKEHVRIGMDILEPLRHIPRALEYIHDHHEHFDGSGYPRGRRGIEISIGGRILAACDAFDAMTSRRAYREALDEKHVIDDLRTHVGRLLDPAVFAALEKVVVRRRTLTFIDDRHA